MMLIWESTTDEELMAMVDRVMDEVREGMGRKAL